MLSKQRDSLSVAEIVTRLPYTYFYHFALVQVDTHFCKIMYLMGNKPSLRS